MPGRKANKKANKKARAKRALTKKPALYKAVKAVAKAEASKLIETKYLTYIPKISGIYNPNISNTLTSQYVGTSSASNNLTYLQDVLPFIPRGDQSNEIIGSRINLISGKTDFLISFKDDDVKTRNLIVKLFCLESRKVRCYSEMNLLPPQSLLRLGNDTTADWTPSAIAYNPINDMFAVNKASFKIHHVKTFHMSKNAGGMNDDASTPPPTPNVGRQFHKFTWHWGREMVLKYDDNPLTSGFSEYPTNFAPVFGIVAYHTDGKAVGSDGGPMPVVLTTVNHMYYKDA